MSVLDVCDGIADSLTIFFGGCLRWYRRLLNNKLFTDGDTPCVAFYLLGGEDLKALFLS